MAGRSALARVRPVVDRWGDLAVAAGLSTLALADVWLNDYVIGSRPLLSVLSLAMTVSLIRRRHAPLLTALVVSGLILLQLAVEPTPHPPDVPFLAWLVTSYSVAAHAGLRRSLAGGVALVVAVGLWSSFSPDDGGTDVVFISVILTGFWVAGRVVRSRNVLAGELSARTRELEQEREENARLAVAEERSRIARELHDIVAHGVSVMVVNAGAERLSLEPGQEATREVLRSIEEAGREALGDMGKLVTVLRGADPVDELDPQPGLARLGALADRVRAAGLEVEVVVEGEPHRLPPGLDVSAYRIVQEALTNAIRHAHGSRARVRLAYGPRTLEIDVADDGLGPRANGRGPGHGLVGIQERVSLFGGELETGRSDLGGYRLSIRLPLTA